MAGAREITEEIRQRVSLLDVVSAHVTLRRTGRNYKGLCPFHSEKTPSFTVDPERGFFYCFGCHAGGDVFDFVMRVGALTFGEARSRPPRRASTAPGSASGCCGRSRKPRRSSRLNWRVPPAGGRDSTWPPAASMRRPSRPSGSGTLLPAGTT